MKLLVATGFTALIITIITCTYVLNSTVKRYSFDSRDIVSAINEDGQLTRDAISGEPKTSASEPYFMPWLNKK